MSMKRFVVALAALSAAPVAFTMPLSAHHSFAAEFDATKQIKLSGTIVKMMWTSPHSWLYVDVKGPDGKVTQWKVEFGAPNALYRRGLRPTSLPAGAEVTIDAFQSKGGEPIASATTVKLPDGQRLFAGSNETPGAPAER